MSIISRKTAGFLLIAGFIIILALSLVTSQPFAFSLILISGLILSVIFLYSPKVGSVIFLIIRPSIDSFSENFSLTISENISFNSAALLGALFVGLTFLFFLKNRKLFFSLSLKFFWLLYLAIVFISIFFSLEPSVSFYEWIRMLSIFSAFALTFAIVKYEKKYNFVWQAILASAILPFLFALYQLITGTGFGRVGELDSRLFGTFSHPNSFASFALIIFAVLVFLISNRHSLIKKQNHIWVFGFLAVTLIILFGTYSRGAWLALLIFAFIISLFKSPKLILAALGILFILFLTSPVVHERIEEIYNPPADSSIRWRFKQWGKMIEAYNKEPLTGYGAGTETLVHEREYGWNVGNPYTHNDFLKTALETGFFGAMAFALLIIATAVTLFQQFQKSLNPVHKDLVLVVFALFVAEIGFSLTSNILRGTATQWTLWALIGATLAITLPPFTIISPFIKGGRKM